jgi:hypothetical protein
MIASGVYGFFRYVAMIGNVVYVLWILRNGINEGFRGTTVQIVSYIGIPLFVEPELFSSLPQKNQLTALRQTNHLAAIG